MAFETIPDIKEAIKLKESELEDRRSIMQSDFDDGYALIPYQAKKKYEAYTSSQPRNFFDKVLDGVNRAQVTIQVHLPENATEEEKKASSDGELYLFGALNAIDRRLDRRGEPPLRQGLGFLMCIRGWLAMRALVYLPKDESEVVFDVQPWDILHTTWEMGPNGVIWAAHKYKATRSQIQAEYPEFVFPSNSRLNPFSPTNPSEYEVVDFYDETNNAVIIGDAFAKELTSHEVGHTPIYISRVGSMPTIQNKDLESTLEHQGDSVWSSSRGLITPRNKWISWVMDNAKRSIVGSLVHKSKDGTKKLKGDPYENYQEIPIDENESIEPLQLPSMPPEAGAALGMIQEDWQQSTLPYPLAYGGTKEAMSGRALSVLADATRSVYSPRTGTLARAYTWLCEELFRQFVNNGKAIELSGYNSKDVYFTVKTLPDSIDPEWFVSVTVEPRMPRDKEAEIMMALSATSEQPGKLPLVSQDTAREEYLRLRDPAAEENKVLAEKGKSLPPIIAKQIAAALKDAGREDLANEVALLFEQQQPTNGVVPPGQVPPPGQMPPPGQAPPMQVPPLPPELVEAIVGILVQVGSPEVAEALLNALGVPLPEVANAPA